MPAGALLEREGVGEVDAIVYSKPALLYFANKPSSACKYLVPAVKFGFQKAEELVLEQVIFYDITAFSELVDDLTGTGDFRPAIFANNTA